MIKPCSSLPFLVLLISLPVDAAPRQRVVACVLDAPGSTAAARPVFKKFFRVVEEAMGWSKGRVTGLFTHLRKRCKREIRSRRTTMALLSPELYLAWKKRFRLRPLAGTKVGGSATTKYHVVVKKGAVGALVDLSGARIYTNHGGDRRYVARVILGGKLGRTVRVRRTRRPLRALRAVHRGEARATIIDDHELAKLKLLSFADELAVIHTSDELPCPLLVSVGRRGRSGARAIAKTLGTLCSGKNQQLCETLRLDGFLPPDQELLGRVMSAYRK